MKKFVIKVWWTKRRHSHIHVLARSREQALDTLQWNLTLERKKWYAMVIVWPLDPFMFR
jgi:hypothetical protein